MTPFFRSQLLSAAALAALAFAHPGLAETAKSNGAAVAQKVQQEAASSLAAPKYGTWGFDLTGMDRSVTPGDDFFKFANGT